MERGSEREALELHQIRLAIIPGLFLGTSKQGPVLVLI
jgi:hypothetical protein